ncbi:TPA: hypothetical protein I9Y37_001945 [Citrobacter freundii]|nr:hypothetical protein [Citrobacter freundii]HAT3963920.1 hypothetical protein [Citrobacter freundii]
MNWFAGNAWDNSYWSAPAGLFTLVVILICSMGNIFLEWVHDSLFDRIFFSIYALGALTTLVHVYNNTEPYNIVKTMLFVLALNILVKFIARLRSRLASGRTVTIHPHEHM